MSALHQQEVAGVQGEGGGRVHLDGIGAAQIVGIVDRHLRRAVADERQIAEDGDRGNAGKIDLIDTIAPEDNRVSAGIVVKYKAVRANPAIERVGAGAAQQRVVAVAPEQGVVAVGPQIVLAKALPRRESLKFEPNRFSIEL